MMLPYRFVNLIALVFFCLLAAPAAYGQEGTVLSDPHGQMKGPYPDGMSVTRECIQCHQREARQVMSSAHWLWRGPSPFVEGREDRTDLGKINLVNNF
ncbi:MAG: hypothetical protein R6X27_07330 [Candidatus Desulfacyla sp.]